jgi:hypothetical protein
LLRWICKRFQNQENTVSGIKDLDVPQGATFESEFRWLKPRFRFEALNAGLSGASAPVWPPNDCDTIVDNTITWINRGPYDPNDASQSNVDCWLPSTAYTVGTIIRTPDEPNDITSYTAKLDVRPDKDDTGTPLLSITETVDQTTGFIRIGDTGGDATTGLFSIVFQAPAFLAATYKTAVYDLLLTSPADAPEFLSGRTTRILEGKLILSKDVTL